MSAIFEVGPLRNKVSAAKPYEEFLRVPAMSAGIYVLPRGGSDRQSPHQQDEIYYVVRGQAKVRIGSRESSVGAGTVVFVEAGAEHRFFAVEEELVLLVVFAPPETS